MITFLTNILETGHVALENYIDVLLKHEVNEEEELNMAFKTFDVNGDGVISADELRTVLTKLGEPISDEDIEEMIRLADVNGDGKIYYDGKCKLNLINILSQIIRACVLYVKHGYSVS